MNQFDEMRADILKRYPKPRGLVQRIKTHFGRQCERKTTLEIPNPRQPLCPDIFSLTYTTVEVRGVELLRHWGPST